MAVNMPLAVDNTIIAIGGIMTAVAVAASTAEITIEMTEVV